VSSILITEEIAQSGIDILKNAGFEVDIKLKLSKEELLKAIKGKSALIIRSATNVDKDVIEASDHLVVIGRAGIGLDNVDVAAATKKGIMVVNAPESNIISAAEHTIGLMLAQARNIPKAHESLISGKWERSKFEGVELHGKTLGIIGLGRVGALVAQRGHAFGMRLVAYDPYISKERAKMMNVEMLDLKELMSQSDFITIHLPKTPETIGLINAEVLNLAKPTVRIVNTARGGIIDEKALYDFLVEHPLAGAALDVFSKEPPEFKELLTLDNIVVTPHLGASTKEAQDKAGVTIAQQILLALKGDFVPYAVNVAAKSISAEVKPFMGLAETLGFIFSSLCQSLPSNISIFYQGEISKEDTSILTLAVIKGVFSVGAEEQISYVNAPQLAQQRGLQINEVTTSSSGDYVSLITLQSDKHSIAGTLVGPLKIPRIVMIDEHSVEIGISDHMLVVRNDDRPGMIGVVGSVLGKAGISISSMAVGPSKSHPTAMMVLSTDEEVQDSVINELKSCDGILSVHKIEKR
jgi:D-3-phosphoglycerate dehydrogenase